MLLGNLTGLRACERVSLSFAVIQIHHHLGSACLLITALAAARLWHWAAGAGESHALPCAEPGSAPHRQWYPRRHVQASTACAHTCTGMHALRTYLYGHAQCVYTPAQACMQCVRTCKGMHSLRAHLYRHARPTYMPAWACTACAHMLSMPVQVCTHMCRHSLFPGTALAAPAHCPSAPCMWLSPGLKLVLSLVTANPSLGLGSGRSSSALSEGWP